MNIPPQSAFFYRGRWSPITDGWVIATAVRMKLECPWVGDTIPSCIAAEAGSIIQKELGVCFSTIEINQRLTILQARYATFKQITTTPGACWVASMQYVVATDEVWKKIIKVFFMVWYETLMQPITCKCCNLIMLTNLCHLL